MKKYLYNQELYSIKELSEMSGITEYTIRERLRRGYPIEECVQAIPTQESVKEFCEVSWWKDWIDTSIDELYTTYWKWCVKNDYSPLSKQGFSRQCLSRYPMLKVIPARYGDKYFRMIRLRG